MASDIDPQRAARIARAEAKAGLTDGSLYRIREGDGLRWVRVSVAFYPKTRWYFEECDGQHNALEGTRQPLDDDLKARLETWL